MDSGSLSTAAKRLRVSQPAVSQVIADLERVLGVELFDRSTRGVDPTRYARALLGRGRAAFDELRQGIRDIEFLADLTARELTIGYTVSIADTILLQIIQSFSEKFPRVVMQANIVPTCPYRKLNPVGVRRESGDAVPDVGSHQNDLWAHRRSVSIASGAGSRNPRASAADHRAASG